MASQINYLLLSALFLLSLASTSTQQGRQIDPEVERKINEYIEDVYLPEAKVSTLGLTIVQNDGEVLYTNGYGWANEEKEIPNSNDTHFLIASVTKSFTALVLIKTLNEKFSELGESVLDTPIRKLIPEFNFTLIDRFRSEHGTVRDLLAHRVCVPRTDWIYYADGVDSSSEISYRQRYNEEVCGIRSDFVYQNQIYVVAGEILSFLSGKPFEETVEDFLRELGMENSRFVRRTDDFINTPDIARPYYVDVNDGILKPVSPELPIRAVTLNAAGGLLISPNEMERYLRLHMNLGKIEGKQLVPEEVIMWMRKPATHIPLMYNYGFGYGQGFFLSEYNGSEFIHHSGGLPPYQSLLSIFPSQNLSVFTSSNVGPLQLDPVVLHIYILEVLNAANDAETKAKKVWNDWKLRQDKKNSDHDKRFEKFLKDKASKYGKPHGRADELVGKYGSGAAGDAEVIEKFNEETNQTGLYVKYGKHATGWLELVSPNLYRIVFDSDIMQDFYGASDIIWLAGDSEAIEFLGTMTGEFESLGVFKAGVSLDKLPPVPWLPDSCRAE